MTLSMEVNNIILGDAKEVLQSFPDESIDLIFTDPPYLKETLYTYDYLANYCPRIMKDGSSLMTIVPHYGLPYVINTFEGKLKYRWIICLNQFRGSHARMAMGIEVMWKPIIWYVKRAYPMGRGFLRDGVEITGKEGQEKKLHIWQQDESWAEYYIQRLTNEGDIVLDPYVGSGTVLRVAKRLNRNYIGIDINPKYVEIARESLK